MSPSLELPWELGPGVLICRLYSKKIKNSVQGEKVRCVFLMSLFLVLELQNQSVFHMDNWKLEKSHVLTFSLNGNCVGGLKRLS